MKKVLIGVGVLVLLGIVFFAFNSYLYIQKQAGPTDWTSAPVFIDEATGVTLHMPQSWQDIGYRIEKKEEGGTIVYTLKLPYLDETGTPQPGMANSDIRAVPIADFTSITDAIGYTDEELGRNSKYVFISRQYSPEAFGSCYSDKGFLERNKQLCAGGSDLRNPERKAGVFILK